MSYQKEYKKSLKEGLSIPQQPNIIGKYILELCTNLGTRHNFNGYSYIDIMIGEAIENCTKAIIKYNPRKTTNIFNYFTTIAWRAFQFRIIEESEQNYTKHKYYQYTYRINELENTPIMDISDNEHSNKVIDDFERKHVKKVAKIKNISKPKNPRSVERLMTRKKK